MGVKIGSEPAGYFDSVGSYLTMISKNRVGAVLVARLQEHKRIVSICPMDDGTAARIGADNAGSNPRSPENRAPKGVSDRKGPCWADQRASTLQAAFSF